MFQTASFSIQTYDPFQLSFVALEFCLNRIYEGRSTVPVVS